MKHATQPAPTKATPTLESWRSFAKGEWMETVNVRDFIQRNYRPYDGEESFLKPSTERTRKLWEKTEALLEQERKNDGVLDLDTATISGVTAHQPGYIDRD